MGRFQKARKAFQKHGASIYAISADSVQTQKKLKKRLGVTFPILADATLKVIRQYNVEHKGSDIARPAVILLNHLGKIVWSKVGRNTRDRPPESVVLAKVKALAASSRSSTQRAQRRRKKGRKKLSISNENKGKR